MTKISGVLYNSNGKRCRTDDDGRFTKRIKISHDFNKFITSPSIGKNKKNRKLSNISKLNNHYNSNKDIESDKISMKLTHEDISNTEICESTSCLKSTNNGVIVNNYVEAKKSLLINKNSSTIDLNKLNNHIDVSNNLSMCVKNKSCFNNVPCKNYVSSSENHIECIIIDSDSEIEKQNSSVKISYNNIIFEYSKENWPNVLKMMQDPVSGVEIFESILTQKFAGQIINNSALGKQRYMIEKFKKRARHWIERYKQLQVQLAEIKTEVLEDKKRFSKLKHYKRTIHTSVGIQANFDSKDLKTLAEVSTNNISSQQIPISDLSLCNNSDSLNITKITEKNVEREGSVEPKKKKKMCDSGLMNKSIPSHGSNSHFQNTNESTTLDIVPSCLEDNNNINNLVTTDVKIQNHKASSYNSSKDVQVESFNTTENITSLINNNIKNVKETYCKLKPVPLAIPLPIAATLSVPTKNASVAISSLNKPGNQEKLCNQLPPMPVITLRHTKNCEQPGVVLLWDLNNSQITSKIISYEIYSYELIENTKKPKQWMRIGEVNALPLPMTCTLKLSNNKGKRYYFAVRAKDIHGHFGPFSQPECAVTPY